MGFFERESGKWRATRIGGVGKGSVRSRIPIAESVDVPRCRNEICIFTDIYVLRVRRVVIIDNVMSLSEGWGTPGKAYEMENESCVYRRVCFPRDRSNSLFYSDDLRRIYSKRCSRVFFFFVLFVSRNKYKSFFPQHPTQEPCYE
jgi:hypothetical protein